MAKVKCFVCNRKIHPKDALKRHNQTFDRKAFFCSRECFEEDEALDEMCKDMASDEVRNYITAINVYFPDVPIHAATCLDCSDYKSGSCEGFLGEPVECMVEKAKELGIKSRSTKVEEFRRW